MATIGDRLKELRITAHKTQLDVSEGTGIALRSYRYYESGERKPDSDMIIKLAGYFSVSVGYILAQTDNPKESIYMWDPARILKNISKICELDELRIEQALEESGVGLSLINDLNNGIRPTIKRMIPLAEYLGTPIEALIGVDLNGEPAKPATHDDIANGIVEMLTEKGLMHDNMTPDEIKVLYERIDSILDFIAKFADNK